MTKLVQPLLTGFETTNFTVRLQIAELTNAAAVRRARDGKGSSIAWIVGHLLGYRCTALGACGVSCPNPYQEKFSAQSPATDGADYPDIALLREQWDDVHTKLIEGVGNLSEEQLLGKSPLPSPHGEPTLLASLAFFTWHEAYHAGVIGALRVEFGYRHTHEIAMEAMAKT